MECIKSNAHDIIIYNYHISTLNWLNPHNIQKIKPNICIPHENNPYYSMFDMVLSTNPLLENGILRPLFEIDFISFKNPNSEIIEFINYGRNINLPIIGSFGFGFDRKGYHHIIDLVNKEYDEAIIKFIIPNSYYGDPNGKKKNKIKEECISRLKKGIQIKFYDIFVPNESLLQFLNSNSINIFAYEENEEVGDGISSVIDYALSVDIPIGITNVSMFRHIYDKKIDIYENSIQNIILKYENKYKNIWSNLNLINKLELLLQ